MKYIGVSGSRDFTDEKALFNMLDSLRHQYGYITLVSGGARGADSLAKKYSILCNVNIIEYLPDYSKGPMAPMMRNGDIANKCDILVACIVKSLPFNGTMDTVRKTGDLNKQIILIRS